MPIWIIILLPAVPALMMGVSDFRDRSVSVIYFIVFGCCCLFSSAISSCLEDVAFRFAVNIVMLLIFYLALKLYFRLNGQKNAQIIDRAFGAGDALFLVCSGLLFDAVPLCMFISSSCIIGIAWGRICRNKEIPFIGLASPVLLVFLLIYNIF